MDWFRQCWNFAGDAAGVEPSGYAVMNATIRSLSGNGSGLSTTALTTEKIAVLAPIPSVSAATAAAVKPRFCQNIRRACFTSARKASTNRS